MANLFDRIFKENIELLFPSLIAKLLGIKDLQLAPIEAKMQVTLEREMDYVRRVVHEDPWEDYGIQIEFHIKDEDLRKRNLLHYAMFHHTIGLPLRQVVVYGGMANPKHITAKTMNMIGLQSEFEVIVLKDLPKETFINSDIPEEVLLAVLCDFGQDKPIEVLRQILQNLVRILKNTNKVGKYTQQLITLSRIRKIELIAKKEIEAMSIHYDIETDGLYLEGMEKGVEKGIDIGIEKGIDIGIKKGTEQGIEQGFDLGRAEVIRKLITKNPQLSDQEIAEMLDVDLEWVKSIRKSIQQ